jgi:hypothetical protein
MQPQQNRTIPLILGFIFFVIGGWSMVAVSPEFAQKNIFIIPAIVLFTIGYIYLFVKWLVNPKKFAEEQQAQVQKMETTGYG